MTFEQALRLAGLHPRQIIPDGKIRRCKSDLQPKHRNGWYVLHPDGRGAWGDWTTGSGQALGSWKDDNASEHAVDPAVLQRLAEQRQREREYRIQAVKSARRYWAASTPLSMHHPYLAKKGLTPVGTQGLRVNDGLLVIPVLLGDSLISIQTIAPDGEKRFWPGAPVKAGAYTLRRDRAAVTVFAEGLATALAVFQAVRTASVICCFDAGNLVPVVERMKPTGSVIFAADNDHKTLVKRGFNPGIDKAKNAAELIGAGVAWPEGIEGSDFADYLQEFGEGAARRVERMILSKVKFVVRAPA